MKHEHTETCRPVGPFFVCKERLHVHLRSYYADRWHHLFVDVVLILALGALIAMVTAVLQKTRSVDVPVEWSSTLQDVSFAGGSARVELRYFTPEGEQIGRGPVQPTVDKKTSVWLLLHVDPLGETSTFDITLSPRSRWTGIQSITAGVAATDDTHHIQWQQCVSAPCGVGDGAFEIEIEPQHDDKGRMLEVVTGGRWLVSTKKDGMIETTLPILSTPPVHD
ncbi:MAG: hypothetical protein Q7S89_01710 [bacterium]|nr:hypothetical protein [bacterium]